MSKLLHKTRNWMLLCVVVLCLAGTLMTGCRAHPVSLGTMLVGDAINDGDVKKRAEILMDEPVSAADAMFGARLETFQDKNSQRQLILYRVEVDPLNVERHGVEVVNGRITALARFKRNIDGSENVLKQVQLKDKVVGKPTAECAKLAKFKAPPVLVARSKEKGDTVRFYDVKNWTNTRGARYCLLRFDENDICTSVDMMGVSASTRKNLAGANP